MLEDKRPIYACVLKSGGDFTVDDVINLRNGIETFAPQPHELHCLTDLPAKCLPDRVVHKQLDNGFPGWWSKICLFKPGMFEHNQRVLYFDLDIVLTGDISPLVLFDEMPVAGRPWRVQEGKLFYGMSSWCMGWHAGAFDHIYTEFRKQEIAWRDRLPVPAKGDQGYIYHKIGEQWKAVQDLLTGTYSWKRCCKYGVPEDTRMIVFHGRPRPREALEESEFLKGYIN